MDVLEVEAASPGLRCCAFLRHSPAAEDRTIAFFQNGTGVYTTAHGDLDGLARSAARSRRMAVLSLDKPGIGSTPEGTTTVEREVFARHTMADLVACTGHAIEAALSQPGISTHATVLAHGHSEGAQVWARVLDTATSREAEAPWLSRVSASLLSGLPMEPVASGAERQLGVFLPFEVDAFRHALTTHDDDYLLLLGMPWRYLEHPTAREGMGDVLDRIALRKPGLRVELFHGDRDRNAPFVPIQELVERSARARSTGHPALDLRLHAYPGANHQLDARLDTDLDALVDRHH